MDTGNILEFAVLSIYTICWMLLALAVWRAIGTTLCLFWGY
jgi:hypothetical protein